MKKNIGALVEARLPTKFGNFKLIAFPGDNKEVIIGPYSSVDLD